jgi:hypothetical protein
MAADEEKAAAKETENLDDDMVKLVAYTIVTLRRDKESIMPEGEASIIVTDRMSREAFIAQIIASYVQERLSEIDQKRQKAEQRFAKRLERMQGQRREEVVKSRDQLRRNLQGERNHLEQSLEVERRYLRVYYVVSKRWPREPMRFEERQIDALRQIRNAMSQ